jgi:hypothetical protein
MIRLHRGNDFKPREPGELPRAHVLRVLYAEPARGAARAAYFLENVEHFRVGAVSNGMDRDL